VLWEYHIVSLPKQKTPGLVGIGLITLILNQIAYHCFHPERTEHPRLSSAMAVSRPCLGAMHPKDRLGGVETDRLHLVPPNRADCFIQSEGWLHAAVDRGIELYNHAGTTKG